MAVKSIGTLVSVLCPTILMSSAALAQVQDRVSATEKGSLIYISDVELKWNAAGALTQDTFIQLTNDNTTGVNVQMYFIQGDLPLAAQPPQPAPPAPPVAITERAHLGCNWIDNSIYLTANQPTYWSAATGQPGVGGLSPWSVLDPAGIGGPGRPDLDPGAPAGSRYLRGFIILWAVDNNNKPISWNHLAANATIVNYGQGSAFEYNGWSIQVVAAINTGDVVPGAFTAGSPPLGKLVMDGVSYAKVFDLLLMNFQAVGATAFSGPKLVTSNTDLTLHLVTHDLRENNRGPSYTKAKFDVWNQNENKFSNAERCIVCWYQALLGTWAPNANHFLRQNLQTDVGKARIDGEKSDVVCPPIEGGIRTQKEALLGIIDTLLTFDGGTAFAEAGTNLFGLGFEGPFGGPDGNEYPTVRYDVLGGGSPPPGEAGKQINTPTELVDTAVRAINNSLNGKRK